MEKHQTPVLIIGAGPAGYTAAIYAARAGLSPLIVTGLQPGGQLTITTDVENYPGFENPIQGPWLMEQMRLQAEAYDTKVVYDTIIDVDFSKRPFILQGDSGAVFEAQSVIIATGAQARWLGLESEELFKGFGVSACATCDGFFFKNKDVAVIGGGNTAVEEALFLSHHARHVTLIHRRNSLRAEKILQKRLHANEKIDIIWDHNLHEIHGPQNPKGVTGITVRHAQTDQEQHLNLDGVFIAIGHDPATQIFKGHINMDDHGYIQTKPDSTATSVEGVYAAGDVKDRLYKQAVTAAGMGCIAALEAEKFLAQEDK